LAGFVVPVLEGIAAEQSAVEGLPACDAVLLLDCVEASADCVAVLEASPGSWRGACGLATCALMGEETAPIEDDAPRPLVAAAPVVPAPEDSVAVGRFNGSDTQGSLGGVPSVVGEAQGGSTLTVALDPAAAFVAALVAAELMPTFVPIVARGFEPGIVPGATWAWTISKPESQRIVARMNKRSIELSCPQQHR
jgi:hypothetical protein